METKDEIVDNLLCMACLCVGRSLNKVSERRLQEFYLDALNEIPLCNMPTECPSICWECSATLKNAVTFREQIKDCFRILQTYSSENLHECLLTDVTRPPRLKCHIADSVSIEPLNNSEIEEDQKMDADDKERLAEVCTVLMKEEMKVEWDGDVDDTDSNHSGDQIIKEEHSIEEEIEIRRSRYQRLDSRKIKKKSKKQHESKLRKDNKVQKLKTDKNLHECLLTDDVTRPPRLKYHIDDSISFEPLDNSELEGDQKMDADDKKGQTDVCTLLAKEEMKVDCSGDLDDTDSNNSVDQIVKEKHSIKEAELRRNRDERLDSKKIKKKSKKQHESKMKKDNKVQRLKTDKNILTIEMSFEDMLKERAKEATKDVYLKAKLKCESCLIGFNYTKSYNAHMASKHSPDIGNYSCPICKVIIPSVESFTAHYKRHMRRYECSICHKRTMDLKVMHQHYYSTHEISLKEYKCNLCGKISNSIDTHRYHKDTHKARIQCPECDKTFSHRAGLMNHRLAVHEYHNDFPCSHCDKVFRWKTSLKRHLEKHEAQNKQPSSAFCSSCGVSFSSVSSYHRHMKNSLKHVTQDEYRFICDHCHRKFADKTKLRDHIEEKHLLKSYKCHICLKPSKNRVGLDQHIRNVHKGRPNNKMCHHCGKGFPTKVQLESHIRTHTGERPFICEFCPTMFSQQSNLYKHNRQVHTNIKSKRYPLSKKRREEKIAEVCDAGFSAAEQCDPYQRAVAVLQYSPERGFVM